MTTIDPSTRITDAESAPARRRKAPAHGDTAPRSEALAPRPRAWHRAAQYVPLAVAVVIDAVLAIPAFNAVLGDAEILSWLCAFGFSLLTVGTAYRGGHEARLRGRALSAILAAASVALIVAVFVMRMSAAAIQSAAAPSYAGAPRSSAASTDLVLAVVMALVMLAGSIAAWVDGFRATKSPEAAAYEASQAHLTALETDRGECAASCSRLVDEAAWATYQLDRVDRDLAEALQGLDALATELQAHARFEIARVLGDPGATSGLDLPIPPVTPVTPASAVPSERN